RLVLACVLLAGAAAALWRLTPPWSGALLAAVAAAGLLGLARARAVPWSACAAVTFAALLVGVQVLLPAYNRRFALRGQLRAHAREAGAGPLTVVCYPQRFDSVGFYLPDAATEVYTPPERGRLLRRLEGRSETLLVVRSGRPLEEL